MKYTPLDIQRREFEKKTFGGLDEGEIRAFLHELAADWEEMQAENQRLKEEILELREQVGQYKDQDRIFRETLLQAQKTKEDLLEGANRERELLLREARYKGDEIIREAQGHVVELEVQLRNLKMERSRFIQGMEGLLDRTRRYLQEEAPEIYFPPAPTMRLEELHDPDHLEMDHIFKPQPSKAKGRKAHGNPEPLNDE